MRICRRCRRTPRTNVLATLSRVRHSICRSFLRMVSAPRIAPSPRDDAAIRRGDDDRVGRPVVHAGETATMEEDQYCTHI